MAILDELVEASFRGAIFFLDRSAISGGRKDTLKEFINSDNQVVEDLGLRQPTFSLSGVIAARDVSNIEAFLGEERVSYKEMRDTWLDAVQSDAGPGVLIHPFYGPIEDIVCRSFTINETIGAVGIASISMTFAVSNTPGLPIAEAAKLGSVATAAQETVDSLENAVALDWDVTEGFAGNVLDAIEKVQAVAAAVEEAGAIVTQVADAVNQFSKFVSDLAADAAALIATPLELAESIRGAFQSLNGLLQTGPAIFESMKSLFDFGDLDIKFTANTAGLNQRQKNRDLLNSQVQGEALSQAYTIVGTLDLPTVEDIDEAQNLLEEQYQKMAAAGAIDRDSFDALTDTRIALTEFFNAQRATRPRRVEVFTNTVPARVLAFNFYGSSDLGDEIAELNEIRDAAFVEGDIEILSQ